MPASQKPPPCFFEFIIFPFWFSNTHSRSSGMEDVLKCKQCRFFPEPFPNPFLQPTNPFSLSRVFIRHFLPQFQQVKRKRRLGDQEMISQVLIFSPLKATLLSCMRSPEVAHHNMPLLRSLPNMSGSRHCDVTRLRGLGIPISHFPNDFFHQHPLDIPPTFNLVQISSQISS